MPGETASAADVSRLLARAAFGATSSDLQRHTGRRYADIVEDLLDVPTLDLRPQPPDEAARLFYEHADRASGEDGISRGFIGAAQRWWLERMRTTPYPLEERMVLFWHDHFATAYRFPNPDIGLLLTQNQTIRRHALGDFRALVEAMTIDPAMLYWLDGVLNQRLAPNENYARELLELFTIGTIPQVYIETDVREAARALTGWQTDPVTRIARFTSGRHDPDPKVVLGTPLHNSGNREYRDLIAILLDHEVAVAGRPARMKLAGLFVAYKLVLNFSYVPSTGDLADDPDPLVVKVAEALDGAWNIRDAVRAMLLADEFRSAPIGQGRQIVRQPIEQVVALCKALGISADSSKTIELLGRMGQLPFDPPNVGGWPFGKDWLSPVTTLARYDWGVAAYELWNATPLPPALPAAADLSAWTARLGLAGLSANTESSIRGYLAARVGAPESERRAGVLVLLASSPDWMVV